MEVDPSGSNSSHSAYSLILQLLQFLKNPLFHQIQNTVKLTFCLQSHTATTTALLMQVSIQAACFCQQKPFSSLHTDDVFWSTGTFVNFVTKNEHLKPQYHWNGTLNINRYITVVLSSCDIYLQYYINYSTVLEKTLSHLLNSCITERGVCYWQQSFVGLQNN